MMSSFIKVRWACLFFYKRLLVRNHFITPGWSNQHSCQQYVPGKISLMPLVFPKAPWGKNDFKLPQILASQILEIPCFIHWILIPPQTYTHAIVFYAKSWQTTTNGPNLAPVLLVCKAHEPRINFTFLKGHV